jgi:hypothetical protein
VEQGGLRRRLDRDGDVLGGLPDSVAFSSRLMRRAARADAEPFGCPVSAGPANDPGVRILQFFARGELHIFPAKGALMANRGSIEYGGGSREVDSMRDDRARGEREWLGAEGGTRGEWGGGWYEESTGPWRRAYAGGFSVPRRGGFAGRGPKGYQRSDERIREDVCERLSEEGEVDASDIEVTVAGAEVTLDGEVDGKEEGRLAEELAEGTPGVRHVNNNLRVKKGFFARLFGVGDEEETDRARIEDPYRRDTRL